MEQVLNQIMPIIITALISVLIIIIKGIGDITVKFIQTKIDEVSGKIGINEYNQQKKISLDIYHFVEEHFRLSETIGKVTEDKINMFNEELKKRIPSITDEQIQLLRQSIAGEINKNKEVILKDVE